LLEGFLNKEPASSEIDGKQEKRSMSSSPRGAGQLVISIFLPPFVFINEIF